MIKRKPFLLLVVCLLFSVLFLLLSYFPQIRKQENKRSFQDAVTERPVVDLGTPNEWFSATAQAGNYSEALGGEGFLVSSNTALLGKSGPEGPNLSDYRIGRVYIGWDVSSLPDKEKITGFELTISLPIGSNQDKPLKISVYQGNRGQAVGLDEWKTAPGTLVGNWEVAALGPEKQNKIEGPGGVLLYQAGEPEIVKVRLSSFSMQKEGLVRLEMRHSNEESIPDNSELITIDRSQLRLKVIYSD